MAKLALHEKANKLQKILSQICTTGYQGAVLVTGDRDYLILIPKNGILPKLYGRYAFEDLLLRDYNILNVAIADYEVLTPSQRFEKICSMYPILRNKDYVDISLNNTTAVTYIDILQKQREMISRVLEPEVLRTGRLRVYIEV